MSVCALIPGYNEAAHIRDVVADTLPYVDKVLVIDDGSCDDTGIIANTAGASVIRNDPNLGKGGSLRRGLDWASAEGFDFAVTLDADGQHIPNEIERFTDIASQYDILVGNRMHDVQTMPLVRYMTNRFTSWVVSQLAKCRIPDTQCGYRLMRLNCWDQLSPHILSNNYDFESEVLVIAGRMGYRIESVPVSTVYADEVSKIHPLTDTIRFFSMVWRLSGCQPELHTPSSEIES